MKKLAIITLYDNINIGNKLQNFAVQTYFENYGFECKTIQHKEMTGRVFNFRNLKFFFFKTFGFPKKTANKLRLFDLKKKVLKKFSDEHLKLGECVTMKKISPEFVTRYDFFVVGSDQVWHNWTHSKAELDYYFLKFAEKKQRLTISPSFGKNFIETEFLNDYISGLQGFSVITCREIQGAKIVKKLTGQDATVLLDPTMLISESEWTKIEKKPNAYVPPRYILIYALGDLDEKMKKYIEKTAFDNGLDIIDICNCDNRGAYLSTPEEFLFYIHHASLVVTDSFHACVFSILFETDFVIFERNTPGMGNMTSRIDTLLSRFEMLDRKFGQEGIVFPSKQDFSLVKTILAEERLKAEKLYQETFRILHIENL